MVWWINTIVFLDVLLHRQRDLLQVALAGRPPAPLPHRREDGEQDGRDDRYNGDDDQKLDEREPGTLRL